MNIKHKIILTTLHEYGSQVLTSRELFNSLDPTDQGTIGGVDAMAKIINNLKDKGWVENGTSEIINGRTMLRWTLSKLGREALTIESINPANRSTDDDCLLIDNDIDGPFLLDPNDALEAPFIDIINMLRVASTTQAAPKIQRKAEKIDTLKRLGNLYNDGIRDLFYDIAADIDALKEA